MASIDERFQAAVNVIKGLPKNGPYQPSTSMMLKFYGLFKQATEGACTQKKPGFWDIVGKAKWDAWNDNRHLSKEQAMLRYVDSLKEIIETMSFTENVQNFVGSLDSLSNINLDELDLVSPGMRELAESHPNSPFHSRTNSPQHGASTNGQSEADEVEAETPTEAAATAAKVEVPTTNGHHLTNGYVTKPSSNFVTETSSVAMVEPSDDEYDDPYDLTNELTTLTQAITRNTELLRQIQSTVSRMNTDVTRVQQRINGVEQTIQQLSGRFKVLRQQPAWWPFKDISPLWFALLVLWPFLVRRFASLLNTNKQRR